MSSGKSQRKPAFWAAMALLALLLGSILSACSRENGKSASFANEAAPKGETAISTESAAFLDSLEERTFRYFWELSDSRTGLTPDRSPTRSFASVAATGFALTAYPIGVYRGYVSREDAARRVLKTLSFFWQSPQDSSSSSTGTHGFYYHFLNAGTGTRFETVELSTIDTAILVAGALTCQAYFDENRAVEDSIRTLATRLYERVDWQWASIRPPTIGHGWTPENGFLPYDWRGYNEAMLLYILALGSPTHPVSPQAWSAWTSGYRWGEFQGEEHIGFAPLFGHQYTQCWVDLRVIQDEYTNARGIDYFENSRRATLAQQKYGIENPAAWDGYGAHRWGWTACDGPLEFKGYAAGRERQFHTYWARGASFTKILDDGTICPAAAAASIAFAPEIVIPTLLDMRNAHGGALFSEYGFLDAFNPSFRFETTVQHGRVDSRYGWIDVDYLGIDQGPILIMVENYRSGMIWRLMRNNPHLIRGLRVAGFHGGWLEEQARDR